jgi:hypothetical protein
METIWKRRRSGQGLRAALELVAQGKSLRAVGASHPTVVRWIKNAA